MNSFSSQITFLNFRDFDRGRDFLTRVLQLEPVYDIGWAVVYRVSGNAFLGAVDHSRQVPGLQTGTLVSLTTDRIEDWHSRLSGLIQVSDIQEIPRAGLKSFFFTGPEGHQFEIQQFLPEDLRQLF